MRRLISAVCVTVSLFLGVSTATAATVSGTMYRTDHFAMAVASNDMQLDDGTPYGSGPTLLICIDVLTDIPPDDEISTFTTPGGADAIQGPGGSLGVAALHWVIDTYFESNFENGTSEQQWAFQYLLWEIGNDFDGTAASINPEDGEVKPAEDSYYPGRPSPFFDAYTTMYQGLIDRLPTLQTTYQSTQYDIDLLINSSTQHQNMASIHRKAATDPIVAVPSNVSVLLLGLMMVALTVGIRRKMPR